MWQLFFSRSDLTLNQSSSKLFPSEPQINHILDLIV